jgi:Bacterial membrane protein YfhO
MPQIKFKEQVLPHLIAVIIFLLITVAYFKPVFFEHKSLNQHDILQWQGGAKELLDYREQHGEEALWTNSMFSGMPGYLITTKWGIGVVTGIQAVISLGLPHPVKVVFLSFLCFYILLIVFKVRPYLAIAGAIAFGLSSFNIIGLGAGHNARITAIAYMPLVLAGVHLAFTRSRLSGLALTALALTLELNANHLQITYYLALIIITYILVQGVSAIRQQQISSYLKTSATLLLAATLALGTFIGSFMSTMEYSKYSIRGKSEITQAGTDSADGLSRSYAFHYSNGIFEPMTLMIPNILGGSNQQALSPDSHVAKAMRRQGASVSQVAQQITAMPTYWGDQPNTAPYYAGAIIVFLFVLSTILNERKLLAWTVPMIILGIVLSWGSNFSSFNYFLFDYFPGYNKFRSVTFALIMSILLMNLLGFIGLEKLFAKGSSKESLRKLLIAFTATGGLSLLLAMFAGMFSFSGVVDVRLPDWLINPLMDDRKAMLQAEAFRSFVFILLAGAVIFAGLKSKLKLQVASLIIMSLVLMDMWTVDKRYLNEDNFSRSAKRAHFAATEADKVIIKDKTLDFRVFNLLNPWNDARTSYYHKSVGGYHGAKLRRYQDLIDRGLSVEQQQVIASLQENGTLPSGMNVINMLNTKYFVAGPSAQAVITNYEAYGNAWLASTVQLVNNPDEELAATVKLKSQSTIVVDQSKFKVKDSYSSSGSIALTSYQPNELKYTASLAGESLIVFSEIYYRDGWQATIDHKPANIIRANYVLRGLEVPAGEHEIIFSFKPKVYNYGNGITTASSIMVLLLVLGTILVELGFIGGLKKPKE